MKIVFLTYKAWDIENLKKFKVSNPDIQVELIKDHEDLDYNKIKKFNPEYIFVTHWSWKIPSEIYDNFDCILFHMTDLPYGQGGSPLQNLILRGHEKTKISAIKVVEAMDAGDVYMKSELSLHGSAEEIFIRASKKIYSEMIPDILKTKPEAQKQIGEVVSFKRRKPSESVIPENIELEKIYDFIRMLDCEGYPNARLELGKLVIEFSEANRKNGQVTARVNIKEASCE